MTILEEICARKRHDLQAIKEQVSPRELYQRVEAIMDTTPEGPSLREALAKSSTGIIAEFKRKSPSKGWIKEEGRADIIPASYEKSGATSLSILTDEPYFGGCMDFVRIARPMVSIPILRKDFMVDEYQVFEAKEIGANAILLIAACLSTEECHTLAKTARSLGLDTLLEIHSEEELDYVSDYISVVGVNNRNLHIFKTDIQTSVDLAAKIPQEFVKISESGLSRPEDVKMLQMCGYHGFLMGERFMKTPDPAQALGEFIKALETNNP